MKYILLSLLIFVTTTAQAAIESTEVAYQVDGKTYQGYLAYDDATEEVRPTVIVVHEWWGLNDYAKMRTEQLAQLGYLAFAIDMYGDGQFVETPDEAGQLAGSVYGNLELAKKNFDEVLMMLSQHPLSDNTHVAAIGYCFGGGIVLNMARLGEDLDGVVSFHGSLDSKVGAIVPGSIKTKILVLGGEDDPMVPATQVEGFNKEMTEAGVDFNVINYKGALHAFTNPAATEIGKKYNLPVAYDEEADKDSWMQMKTFFNKIFNE